MEGNKAMLPGEEGMKALLGGCVGEHGEDAGGVGFFGGGSPPTPSRPPTMLPRGEGSVLCGSLCPLATSMSDPEQGRGGWINLAKQKNE